MINIYLSQLRQKSNYPLPWCVAVVKVEYDELQGITLSVYLHVVRKDKPVGPRDVMKAAQLSSPSVAYRHLQKLEELGLLQKNEYGEYLVKKKAHIKGFVWLGHRLIPALWRYSIIFFVVLMIECFGSALPL